MIDSMKNLLKFLLIFSLIATSSNSFAQDNDDPLLDTSMRDALTVVAMGTVGAILGLSTLSFVEEPKEHLKNIVVGGAVGIIIGVGVVAWGQASKSRDSYQQTFDGGQGALLQKEFPSYARQQWHREAHRGQVTSLRVNNKLTGQLANYTFSF
jgi:hypothetical protein